MYNIQIKLLDNKKHVNWYHVRTSDLTNNEGDEVPYLYSMRESGEWENVGLCMGNFLTVISVLLKNISVTGWTQIDIHHTWVCIILTIQFIVHMLLFMWMIHTNAYDWCVKKEVVKKVNTMLMNDYLVTVTICCCWVKKLRLLMIVI